MREEALKEQRVRIQDRARRMIWVTFRKEGIHRFPAAATDPKYNTPGENDVSFLGNAHRHIFHFRVAIQVNHNDRDIEFIQFKRWLESLYSKDILELDFKSCEMISDDLYQVIAERYPERDIIIEVAEDGENGSYIEYNTTKPYQSTTI
jgi:hypothetical protein